MVKKLTQSDWDKLQRQSSIYFVQSVEDGKLRVKFDSELVVVEPGDEDLIGRMRPDDRAPIAEARVIIDGESKIYIFGNPSWSFTRSFIEVCKKNGLKPEDIPGSVFDITKTGDWEYEIKYVGKEDGSSPASIKIDDRTKSDILDTITEIKKNSPDILKDGIGKNAFIKMIYIRGKINTSDTEALLPELEKEGILEIKGDKIFVI